MPQIQATYRDGQVILDAPVDWPDGTRVELYAELPQTEQPSGEELDRLLNELADIFEASTDPNVPPLSDYAVSRAGIYGEHP